MYITIVIIAVTCLVSFTAFNNRDLYHKLIFYPTSISQQNQWYRFFSNGLIHADMQHLIFNMLTLFFFGGSLDQRSSGLEGQFNYIFQEKGSFLYITLYVGALGVCLLPTYQKNKNNYHYASLGASGAVSAVVFGSIMLNPLKGMGLFFIPVYIAGFLFGGIYLAISYWMDKRNNDQVNHSAHLWGALFGIVYVIFTCNALGDYPVLAQFIDAIKHARISDLIRVGP